MNSPEARFYVTLQYEDGLRVCVFFSQSKYTSEMNDNKSLDGRTQSIETLNKYEKKPTTTTHTIHRDDYKFTRLLYP